MTAPANPKPVRWVVIANVFDPKSSKLRRGAKVVVRSYKTDTRARVRCQVRGLSIGGRTITTHVAVAQLHNFRTASIRSFFGYAARATAARLATFLVMQVE